MAEGFAIEETEERVILVGVSGTDDDGGEFSLRDFGEDSLDELAELVKTAGAAVVGRLLQKRELMHPGTYVGTGKVAEIKEMAERLGATGIVCDDELSPAQLKNLEQALEVKVMDRTLIILDIFAAARNDQRGKDSGRAGAVKIPAEPPDGTGTFALKARRRYRYKGTR